MVKTLEMRSTTVQEVIINKMVLTIIHLDGGHITIGRVRNMHITTDDQGSSSYAGGYRYTDEHGKIWFWGRNNWCTGHNWWTHGWTSTDGYAYNQGHGR